MTVSTPGLVWHYTNGAALMNILEKNELWASSAAFMNDANELLSGSLQLRQYFEEQRSSLPSQTVRDLEAYIPDTRNRDRDSFVLSASSDGDSLTLWRNYGREHVSFAVGLDESVPLVPIAGCLDNQHPNPSPGYYDGMYEVDVDGSVLEHPNGAPVVVDDPDRVLIECSVWKSVVYDRDDQKQLIGKVFNNLRAGVEERRGRSEESRRTFWLYPYLMNEDLEIVKNVGFQDEREKRVVVWLNPDWKFVFHRTGPFGLVPYVKLTSLEGAETEPYETDYVTAPGRLPIREIRVGPTPYGAGAVRSLKQMLDFQGFHDVTVSYSEIPFRQ
ncbi:hypothetical protein [Arthrobacter sp. YN]|uniref:hypothetical protein n=1 Tax=Arthrobacter sp. YN TaxID=2020486 RepID=UPI000B5ED513|nr:hypothetical protein [Arthrobacter sp. YN]ASN20124.1 hypothetical protein CGK93_10930 [Arthrobacter sp. YN]